MTKKRASVYQDSPYLSTLGATQVHNTEGSQTRQEGVEVRKVALIIPEQPMLQLVTNAVLGMRSFARDLSRYCNLQLLGILCRSLYHNGNGGRWERG